MTTLKEIGIVFGIIGLVFFVCLIFNFLVFGNGTEQIKNFLSKNISNINQNTTNQNIITSPLYEPNNPFPHWKYLPIKYYFDDTSNNSCSVYEKQKITHALTL